VLIFPLCRHSHLGDNFPITRHLFPSPLLALLRDATDRSSFRSVDAQRCKVLNKLQHLGVNRYLLWRGLLFAAGKFHLNFLLCVDEEGTVERVNDRVQVRLRHVSLRFVRKIAQSKRIVFYLCEKDLDSQDLLDPRLNQYWARLKDLKDTFLSIQNLPHEVHRTQIVGRQEELALESHGAVEVSFVVDEFSNVRN
jgi:hypothetical protein